MTGERQRYTFEPHRLHAHEIAVLGMGRCSAFLPTTFMWDDETLTAVYECTGFSPLSDFRIEHTADILYILEKLLTGLQRSQEHLILPERILLSSETVFYDQKTGSIRMAFVPVKVSEPDIHRNLLQFLLSIRVDLCDHFHSYIDRFAHRSVDENMDIDSMLTLVGLLRREIDEKMKVIA